MYHAQKLSTQCKLKNNKIHFNKAEEVMENNKEARALQITNDVSRRLKEVQIKKGQITRLMENENIRKINEIKVKLIIAISMIIIEK